MLRVRMLLMSPVDLSFEVTTCPSLATECNEPCPSGYVTSPANGCDTCRCKVPANPCQVCKQSATHCVCITVARTFGMGSVASWNCCLQAMMCDAGQRCELWAYQDCTPAEFPCRPRPRCMPVKRKTCISTSLICSLSSRHFD